MRLAIAFALIASPVSADVDQVVSNHILPGYAALAESTKSLDETAGADCNSDDLIPAYHAAYDDWISISHIQFGPLEDQGLQLAMAFWPDPKDRTAKAIERLTSISDPIVDDPDTFSEVSVAAQGFTALERVLFETQSDEDYACRLTRAIAAGLAQKAAVLDTGWQDHAKLLRNAGQNERYQSETEAKRALFTAISTGLEFLHDQRLGRPLGTFERPRPKRAEARRSQRTLSHVILSLDALESLAVLLAGDIPKSQAAFANARTRALQLKDPTLAGVGNPAGRFKIEVLQQSVRAIQVAIVEEIGRPLGVQAGFNALDGD